MKLEATIKNFLTGSDLREIKNCVFAGFDVHKELINQIQALNRKQTKRVIRGYAVEQQFENACRIGRLPFICEKKLNASRSAEHLELSNSKLILTIRSVTYPKQLPPRTIYQDQIIESCQGDFFNNPNLILAKSVSSSPKTYLIVTYGGKGNQPDFIYLGSPLPERRGWKFLINLMELPYEVPLTESEKAVEVEEAVLKLKIEYDKPLDKKNGENKC